MRKTITILFIASFCFLGTALAKDTDVELTGWPYQVDVVRENLGRFTSQSGLMPHSIPFRVMSTILRWSPVLPQGRILMWSMFGTVFWLNGPQRVGSSQSQVYQGLMITWQTCHRESLNR